MAPQTEWQARIHAPGEFSIVIQGGLSKDNAESTATNCRHWRELFPSAEIILSLSGTTLLRGHLRAGLLLDAQANGDDAHDVAIRNALNAILESCNKIALCDPARPLPRIKLDSPSANHINLQIAAAKNGLAQVTCPYVLRVRSDLILLDYSFLDQYRAGALLPRGNAAVLSQRVLISWLFTLNPYTVERLPLHFSDWFHFGPTVDVRKLWDVPFVSPADAQHYMAHPHAADSNAAERLFLIRLAVEQHLVYHSMRASFPDLTLAYHNDRSSVTLAMDILADNFVVADVGHANCIFPKYSLEFDRTEKLFHCITAEDWRAMATYRNTDYRITLSHKIRDRQNLQSDQRPGYPRFPVHLDVAAMQGHQGPHAIGQSAPATEDLFLSSPALPLQPGHYIIALNPVLVQGEGTLAFRAMLGRDLLAKREITIHHGDTADLTMVLHIFHPDALVTIICTSTSFSALSISALIIAQWNEDAPALPRYYEAADLHMAHGRLDGGCIVANGQDGRLCYGPYIDLPQGAYVARVDLRHLQPRGQLTISITADVGARILAQATFLAGRADAATATLAFDVDAAGVRKLEVVCGTRGLAGVAVRGILIAERDDQRVHAANPLSCVQPPTWRRYLATVMRRDLFARIEDLPV